MKTLLSSSRRRLRCLAGLVALALIAFAICACGFTADALTAPELWIGGLAVGLVAERVQEGERRHHTPSGSSVTAGDVLQLGDGLAGVAINDIADGVQGAVHVGGIYKLTNVEASTTFAAGGGVAWDTANNEAVAPSSAAADFYVGRAIAATSSGGDPVTVELNRRVVESDTDLTDNSGGTADGTVEAVSGSGADAAINNNFAEMATELNDLRAKLRDAGLLN